MSVETFHQYQKDHLQQLGEISHMILPNVGPDADPTSVKVAKGYAFGAFRELQSEGLGQAAEIVVFEGKHERNIHTE